MAARRLVDGDEAGVVSVWLSIPYGHEAWAQQASMAEPPKGPRRRSCREGRSLALSAFLPFRKGVNSIASARICPAVRRRLDLAGGAH